MTDRLSDFKQGLLAEKAQLQEHIKTATASTDEWYRAMKDIDDALKGLSNVKTPTLESNDNKEKEKP